MNTKPLFVTGIGTYVGKTIASAVLCQQLKADYWKPVQAGDLEESDSRKVMHLISNFNSVIHPETFRLQMAASPHHAAQEEDINIDVDDFIMPKTDNRLIIEGAGGLMVPLSRDFLMADLITQFNAEVVLVIRNYLGCINHSLLSMQAIDSLGLSFKHVIFNGNFSEATLDVIMHHIPEGVSWSMLPEFQNLTKMTVALAPTQILAYT